MIFTVSGYVVDKGDQVLLIKYPKGKKSKCVYIIGVLGEEDTTSESNTFIEIDGVKHEVLQTCSYAISKIELE